MNVSRRELNLLNCDQKIKKQLILRHHTSIYTHESTFYTVANTRTVFHFFYKSDLRLTYTLKRSHMIRYTDIVVFIHGFKIWLCSWLIAQEHHSGMWIVDTRIALKQRILSGSKFWLRVSFKRHRYLLPNYRTYVWESKLDQVYPYKCNEPSRKLF